MNIYYEPAYLQHHGVKGMKWGVRRNRNKDGSLTVAGRKRRDERYTNYEKVSAKKQAQEDAKTAKKAAKKEYKQAKKAYRKARSDYNTEVSKPNEAYANERFSTRVYDAYVLRNTDGVKRMNRTLNTNKDATVSQVRRGAYFEAGALAVLAVLAKHGTEKIRDNGRLALPG